MEHFKTTQEAAPPFLEVSFSVENETERIDTTLKKYSWYKEKNYDVYLPKNLDPSVELTAEEIKRYVEQDFDRSFYEQKAIEIKKEWETFGRIFFEKATSNGISLLPSYEILLTRYGVGGSYGFPNKILLNVDRKKMETIMRLLPHEMIHLAIERWIKEYNIPHWTKERIVDLTYSRILDKEVPLQNAPEAGERVQEVFDRLFPDLKKIIIELSSENIK